MTDVRVTRDSSHPASFLGLGQGRGKMTSQTAASHRHISSPQCHLKFQDINCHPVSSDSAWAELLNNTAKMVNITEKIKE
jgi:hypothetical protein